MATGSATIRLNPQQRTAVEHLHGPALVIAGAGTGKTRVIIERILYLLDAIPALGGENLLAITYTTKAADEMRARLRRRGPKRAERVEVHTFHAFCIQLLRRHDEALKQLDETDYWIFLRRRLHRLGLRLFLRLSEPGLFLTDFMKFFSRCQDELVSPADYRQYVAALERALADQRTQLSPDELEAREDHLARHQELARAYAAAEELLTEARCTTFGGSLFSAVQLLRNREDLRRRYQEQFRYILVDEFQDANVAQIELLRLLAETHRNLMAVGDDDQAIYRFRGASYASFKLFDQLYPDARKVTLVQNYRSTARILRVAAALIAANGAARFDPNKQLRPLHAGGEKVRLAELDDAATEAAFVRDELIRSQEQTGRFAGLAVLYRSHAHRNALVEALARAGVPFVIRGLSILAHPLIRDLLAWLRVLNDPRDNISFARLLALPRWRLTPEMFLDLVARARRENLSLADAAASLHPDVRDRQTDLGELLRLLDDLRPRIPELPLTELFDLLLDRLELRLLATDPARPFLDTWIEFLRQWEREKSDTRRLPDFIEYFTYFEEAGGKVSLPEETAPRDAVQLMTVHAAKGLEFDSVFLLRLNQNDFPPRAHHATFEFPEELMKEPLPPGDFRIQEERRLCYVSLTRAQRRLSLSSLLGPRKKPSIFLEDVLRDPHAARDLEQLEPPPSLAAPSPPAAAEDSQPALFAASADTSRIPAWAEQPDPPPDQTADSLALSHSALETFDKCPLKYKFDSRWRLPGRSTPAMVFGSIMHRTVADFFRACPVSGGARPPAGAFRLDELQHLYEQQWRATPWPFPDSYQQEQYRTGGWEQLQTFFEQVRAQPPSVLELEKTFSFPWEDVLLTGRIDQINRLDARQVEIIEYKTGQPRDPKTVEKSIQLALYALAARERLRLEPARLTLYNFTAGEAISVSPNQKALERAQDMVRRVAAGIRAGEFPARPGFHCRYCDYRPLCPAHEQGFPLRWGPAPEKENREVASKQDNGE